MKRGKGFMISDIGSENKTLPMSVDDHIRCHGIGVYTRTMKLVPCVVFDYSSVKIYTHPLNSFSTSRRGAVTEHLDIPTSCYMR